MRRPKLARGCRPMSRRERARLKREQHAAEWPDVRIWRLIVTCEHLEDELARLRAPPGIAIWRPDGRNDLPPTSCLTPPMPTSALQDEGTQIFQAQRAAERLLERVEQSGHSSVVGMSRDELRTLALRLSALGAIAARYHLEKAAVGSLPLDSFPGPTE